MNVSSWIHQVHLFLDNAVSTNKNCYFISWAIEMVEQQVVVDAGNAFNTLNRREALHNIGAFCHALTTNYTLEHLWGNIRSLC